MNNVITPGGLPTPPTSPLGRRLFLRYAGFSVATGAVLIQSCKKDDDTVTPGGTGATVDLGTGDIGILNYAYALEQLEAAFYTQVIQTPYNGITADERSVLTDIRDHEVIHREFFKAALGQQAIPGLQVNFTTIDFNSRSSVLGAAKTFEDLGVSAYNGAGKFIKDANYLLLAGKIVSVEARHAAVIRDLLNMKSADFAGDDVVAPTTGLDVARVPSVVLPLAQPFVVNRITASGLS